MLTFLLITIIHLLEHIAQAIQLWILHWQRIDCLGLSGLMAPWLARSEWLHYSYALFMLIGLWILRSKMIPNQACSWWSLALWLQFFHHFEHALLLSQKLFRRNLFNSPVPISIGQILVPRIELHLFYNLVVVIPIMIALFYNRKAKIMGLKDFC